MSVKIVAISETGRDSAVLQERCLDRTILRTYRTTVSLDNILPNPKQPRLGPKEDEELQRQIEANEGLFEPLLVEPHPEFEGKYLIIDGDRRWTNCRVLEIEVASSTVRFRSRSPTALSQTKNASALGYTSIANAKSGMPRERDGRVPPS